MKRTPKKPPKPLTAAEVAAEERQRMISSDLEQIRRYIGEIARLMASYRAENVSLRAQLADYQCATDAGSERRYRLLAEAEVRRLNELLAAKLPRRGTMAEWPAHGPVTYIETGQAAAQLLRPQDFATELPADD